MEKDQKERENKAEKEVQDWLLLFKKRMNQSKKQYSSNLQPIEEERKVNKTPDREVIDKYVRKVTAGNKR